MPPSSDMPEPSEKPVPVDMKEAKRQARRARVKMTSVNMAYNLSTVVHLKRRGMVA